jgi:hypothetical protein
MDEFKPNSHRSKETRGESVPEKKMDPVISGAAKIKKKSGTQKFAEVFIQEDINSVKSYIFNEVVVPYVKDALLDIVSALLGRSKHTSRNGSAASQVSYRSFYNKENDRGRNNTVAPQRSVFDYEEIVFESRDDAELVLETMNELILQYGVVSVGDFYDLARVSTNNYATNKYGWADLRSCRIMPVRGGYVLKLPRALSLG